MKIPAVSGTILFQKQPEGASEALLGNYVGRTFSREETSEIWPILSR